jgi:hypothetical protein
MWRRKQSIFAEWGEGNKVYSLNVEKETKYIRWMWKRKLTIFLKCWDWGKFETDLYFMQLNWAYGFSDYRGWNRAYYQTAGRNTESAYIRQFESIFETCLECEAGDQVCSFEEKTEVKNLLQSVSLHFIILMLNIWGIPLRCLYNLGIFRQQN